MSVAVERDALAAVLRRVADVVESRTTIAITGNLLLVARNGELTVTGTDLDIQASAIVEAAGEIETTIDARKLVAAVTSLKPGTVTIAAVEGRAGAVTIKSGRGVRTLPTLPATDFPLRKDPEAATRFAMPAASLARLLDTTHVAMSSEETRYYLCGVYLHLTDGRMCAAATDGHKLVRSFVSAPEGSEGAAQIIVPTKTIGILRKLLVKAQGDAQVAITENVIEVQLAGTRIVSKTIDGTFPDYRRVIPDEASDVFRMVVTRDALIEAGGAVAAVVDGEGDSKYRVLRFDLEAGKPVAVSARDQAGAQAHEEMEAAFTGEPTALGLNQRYVAAVASVFADGAAMTLCWAGPTAPVRITTDKDPDMVAVIMPMRT